MNFEILKLTTSILSTCPRGQKKEMAGKNFFSSVGGANCLSLALRGLRCSITCTPPSRCLSSGASGDVFTAASRPLQGEASRQFLTSDKETIVCIHPSAQTDISTTKPLHPYRPERELVRKELTPDEAEFVKRLRSEDPALWSIATLARLFIVKRIAISKVAPADKAHQEHLDKEKDKMAKLKPYKRKIYLAQRQMERQKRLERIIADRNYKFPNQPYFHC